MHRRRAVMSNRSLVRRFRDRLVRASLVSSLFVLCPGGAWTFGCSPQDEGDRCESGTGTSQCASGLTCVVPRGCIVSYCCPTSQKNATGVCADGCPTDEDAATDDTEGDASETAADEGVDTAPADTGTADAGAETDVAAD